MPANVQGEAEPSGVVILAGDHDTSRIVFHALKNHIPIRAVIVEDHSSRVLFIKKRIRRLGVGRVLGQLGFQFLLVPWLERFSKKRIREICSNAALDSSPIHESVLARVASANGDETIALLQRLRPRVVVINGTRIISKKVLESIPAVFLNTHAGITPLFRGVHGGYWALATGQSANFGVTIHLVDPGVDTGGIVAQARTRPSDRDGFCTYPYIQLAAGLPLLREAVRDALDGRASTIPAPAGVSKMWSHPTLWGYAWTRVRFKVK